MSADPKVGGRVVHIAHGAGTVIERNGDEVLVELDVVPGSPRKFLLSRGTLSVEGSPTAPTAPANAEAERREIFNPNPPAKAAPPDAPAKAAAPETPMTDTLLTELNHEITKRGRGAIRELARTLLLHDASIHGWRSAGSIPENRREGVRAWIDRKPAPEPPEHKPTTTSPKPRVAVAKKVKKSRPAPSPGPLRGGAVCAGHGTPTISAGVAERVAQGLGLQIVEAWIPEGIILRKARVAVLPD